jgi:iron-sulfur cluster assembly protein
MEKLRLALDERERLLDALLEDGVALGHECGGKLACATCRVVILEGLDHLRPASDDELDMLDRAGASAPGARLACQAVADGGEVVIELSANRIAAGVVAFPISASERAANYLRAQLAKQPGAVAVRLAVEPTGCSGFGYRVERAEAIRDDDVVFECRGVRIAVDPASLPYLYGTVLDVVQEGLARRLRFDNPNARQTCGCGESFGVQVNR